MSYLARTLPQPFHVVMSAVESAPSFADAEAMGLRLRAARKDAGLSTSEAARLGGISVSQLGNIERGHHPLTSVSAGGLRPLAAAFGLSWPAFVGMVAPVYAPYIPLLNTPSGPPDARNPSYTPELSRVESEFIMKPVHALAQASRPVGEMEPLEHGSPIPVERSRLRSGTVLFEVAGESMRTGEATGILPGDVVFVDTAEREAVAGRIYVIHIPADGVCIKRVRNLGGSLWLFSDNPDQDRHPPFQVDEAQIIGHAYYRQPRGESLL